jgi:CheY-like chemotaxis protein
MIPADECGKRILVVEDDAITLSAIRMVLTWEGYVVDCARNGREALDRLRSSAVKPDLILLDVRMPVLDGEQFRQEQQGDPALRDIPVVVISGDGSACPDASARLHKPFPPKQLLEVVRSWA